MTQDDYFGCQRGTKDAQRGKDRWHSLECLESGSVLYEAKDGAYHPLEEDEIFIAQP